MKPANPYAGALSKSASMATNYGGGYSAKLEGSGLDRGLSSVGVADATRPAARSPSGRRVPLQAL